jgi:hypothetical protein
MAQVTEHLPSEGPNFNPHLHQEEEEGGRGGEAELRS